MNADDFQKLRDYARRPVEIKDFKMTDKVPHPDDPGRFGLAFGRGRAGPAGDTHPPAFTVLKPKVEPTLRDEILVMLKVLTAEIESGKVTPSHLIMGWGTRTTLNGEPATSYEWDTVGLNTYELLGHLQSYSVRLVEEDD